MGCIIRMYLRVEPSEDIEKFFDQYAEAVFIEKRKQESMAIAIARVFQSR